MALHDSTSDLTRDSARSNGHRTIPESRSEGPETLDIFFLAHPSWSYGKPFVELTPRFSPFGFAQNLILVRIPLLIQYSLMAIVLVAQPVLTKTLLRQLTFLTRLGRQVGLLGSILLHAALTFAQVFRGSDAR